MRVSIVGAGNMAGGIATRAALGGHSVRIVARDATKGTALADEVRGRVAGADVAVGEGVAGADVVVLAVPYGALKDVLATYGDALNGKTVVDISNPVDFSTFDALVVPADSSAAEELATVAPGVNVVKAFNTTFAGTLLGDEKLDVFIAGDDETARQQVAQLASDGGLRPVDVGALRHSRALEGFQLLHMKAQQSLGTNWQSALRIA
ncbi:NADPH-dependent F420 reductase [Tenggerimyces flavus]|uniref:NADPH-dependent F420 reductase n=1 Tax=Tenggerimyces flavus TaxID=1708749 RepID=A0ABV7YJH5_9ACTN|nr:NADPH-dependent F420 reductase [Tenggerimyces flavus]MBM7787463.1 putative dinucleotide-binding enzyme [Tenggerimyces flavus]